MRKGDGMEAILCYLGTILVDATSGLIRAAKVTPPCGMGASAEVLAAIELAQEHMTAGQTIIGDRGFDLKRFFDGILELGLRAHPRAKSKGSGLDGRTTKRQSYKISMSRRFIVEQFFGWLKSSGRIRQVMKQGLEKVGWEFHLYCMAYNLRRMANAG